MEQARRVMYGQQGMDMVWVVPCETRRPNLQDELAWHKREVDAYLKNPSVAGLTRNVKLVLQNGYARYAPAFLLIAYSEVLRKLIRARAPEQYDAEITVHLNEKKFENITNAGLCNVVSFIQVGQIKFLESELEKVLTAASDLEVLPLVQFICEEMAARVNENTATYAFPMLRIAVKTLPPYSHYRNLVVNTVASKYKQIPRHAEIACFSFEMLNALISSPVLHSNERITEIYETIINWLYSNSDQMFTAPALLDNINFTDIESRDTLEEMLRRSKVVKGLQPLVQFYLMDAAYYAFTASLEASHPDMRPSVYALPTLNAPEPLTERDLEAIRIGQPSAWSSSHGPSTAQTLGPMLMHLQEQGRMPPLPVGPHRPMPAMMPEPIGGYRGMPEVLSTAMPNYELRQTQEGMLMRLQEQGRMPPLPIGPRRQPPAMMPEPMDGYRGMTEVLSTPMPGYGLRPLASSTPITSEDQLPAAPLPPVGSFIIPPLDSTPTRTTRTASASASASSGNYQNQLLPPPGLMTHLQPPPAFPYGCYPTGYHSTPTTTVASTAHGNITIPSHRSEDAESLQGWLHSQAASDGSVDGASSLHTAIHRSSEGSLAPPLSSFIHTAVPERSSSANTAISAHSRSQNLQDLSTSPTVASTQAETTNECVAGPSEIGEAAASSSKDSVRSSVRRKWPQIELRKSPPKSRKQMRLERQAQGRANQQ